MKIWFLRLVILLLVSAGASFLTVMIHHRLTQPDMRPNMPSGIPAWALVNASQQSLRLVLDELVQDLDQGRTQTGEELAARFEQSGSRLFVLDASGTPLLNSQAWTEICADRQGRIQGMLDKAPVASGAELDWMRLDQDRGNEECLVAAFDVPNGQRFYVGLASPPQGLPPDMDRIHSISHVIGLLVGIATLITLIYVTERPTRKLRQALHGISRGDFSIRLYKKGVRHADNLSRLMEDFNVMAESLARNYQAQQLLIGEISHEIRAPLNRMVFAAELANTADREQTQMLLRQICTDSQRMGKILEKIVMLSRANTCAMDFQDLDLATLCEGVVQSARLAPEIQSKTVSFTAHATPTIRGGQEFLESMLENLILNAVKYTHDRTEVAVSLSTTREGGPKETGRDLAVIDVRDQGPGIPEEDLPHVFEPFYRSASTASKQGSGLGLTIARHMALIHGGDISLHNNNGTGLHVRVTLPISTT